jgi:hypothetical protein
LIARLCRFYGGSPLSWLSMRPAVRDAMTRMLPRLQAEEDLRMVSAVAAGVGSMKDADRMAYLRRLTRTMGANAEAMASAGSSADPWGLGVPVVKEVVEGG